MSLITFSWIGVGSLKPKSSILRIILPIRLSFANLDSIDGWIGFCFKSLLLGVSVTFICVSGGIFELSDCVGLLALLKKRETCEDIITVLDNELPTCGLPPKKIDTLIFFTNIPLL